MSKKFKRKTRFSSLDIMAQVNSLKKRLINLKYISPLIQSIPIESSTFMTRTIKLTFSSLPGQTIRNIC